MNLFAKKIVTTKADPPWRDAAIATARRDGIGAEVVLEFLENCASALRAPALIESDRRRATPKQYVATEHGVKVVDVYAEQAKAEEKRIARELRRQQAEYQQALEERAEHEKWTR